MGRGNLKHLETIKSPCEILKFKTNIYYFNTKIGFPLWLNPPNEEQSSILSCIGQKSISLVLAQPSHLFSVFSSGQQHASGKYSRRVTCEEWTEKKKETKGYCPKIQVHSQLDLLILLFKNWGDNSTIRVHLSAKNDNFIR